MAPPYADLPAAIRVAIQLSTSELAHATALPVMWTLAGKSPLAIIL